MKHQSKWKYACAVALGLAMSWAMLAADLADLAKTQPVVNNAIIPAEKLETDSYDWYKRHDQKKADAAKDQYELIFIGDSITHSFEEGSGAKVWKNYYSSRKPLNLGFGWDRTQNVLWRLQNGEFANQKPKMVVLEIGTNNLSGTANARQNTTDEIAEGIKMICGLVLEKTPETHIVIMGVFPRAWANSYYMSEIRVLNKKLKDIYAGNPKIEVLDIFDSFIGPDGQLKEGTMLNDRTHPSEAGYQLWAEALEPVIVRQFKDGGAKTGN